jgi:hypothetical protein
MAKFRDGSGVPHDHSHDLLVALRVFGRDSEDEAFPEVRLQEKGLFNALR